MAINTFMIETKTVEVQSLFSLALNQKFSRLKQEKTDAFKALLTSSDISSTSFEKALGMADESYDIFLSYSHDDVASMVTIYDELTARGFSVFADYFYWGSIDQFLKEWKENEECKGNANPEKIGQMYSTAYIILETMLTKTLVKSKTLIFLNKKTLEDWRYPELKSYSPWIYHELFTVNLLNQIENNQMSFYALQESLRTKVSFKEDLSRFSQIDQDCWKSILTLPKTSESRIEVLKIFLAAHESVARKSP